MCQGNLNLVLVIVFHKVLIVNRGLVLKLISCQNHQLERKVAFKGAVK